ncbi:MAG: protein kinase [Bryobacteraceae bacterium]|jgi:serine/threonine protein kinase/tetratricopeptide (TPR) repeat protein
MLVPGDRLGPYRLVASIGKGGMGEVYRATDTRMGRDVAIKVVAEQFIERFDREVRAIAALNHPNICTIYDVGPNYLVMEYVDGVPLKGPQPEATAMQFAAQIAAALDAAHARGIVHCDLKPANMLVTGDRLKLLDFGVARLASAPTRERREAVLATAPYAVSDGSGSANEVETVQFTVSNMSGTPAYMSPEQAAGQMVDTRSDIFSFGVVLYELLSGRRPFPGETMNAVLSAIRDSEPAPLEASLEVTRLVFRCLRKSPDERFQSMSELRPVLEKATASLTRKEPSVAVLPFVMTGAGAESEYFSEGLAEDIINALSGVSGLKVIARTSTFAFKDKVQDIRGIAEALGVDHVLEGSVRTAGNRIRVNTRLISGRDGSQLWSKRFDRDLIDVFIIQDEISNAIANELKVSLTTQKLVKAPTNNFAAYEAVLQGRYHFLRFDPADQAKALAHFERAVAIDPEYAAAHIGIALDHWGQMVVGMADPRQAMQRSVEAAREALRLDPANSEGHHILASYYALHDFDWAKAEHHFDRALELNPHSLWAYHCKTIYLLLPLGRLEEAVECQDRALAIDPLTPAVLANLALALEGLHREQEEAQVIDRVTQLDPNFVGGLWTLVRFRIRQGRIAEAVELAERLVQAAGRWGMTLGALGAAYAAAGRVDEARQVIAELGLEHNRESRAFYSFLIAAALDDRDAAFRWAAESIEHRDPIMLSFLWTSSFDQLRDDPRFAGLLRTLKIEDRRLASASRLVG